MFVSSDDYEKEFEKYERESTKNESLEEKVFVWKAGLKDAAKQKE